MQCHSCGQQRAALPNKSYEGTHACTHVILGLCSNTWHKGMPRDSPFFICWAFSSAQVPSEMIILTLPRRESFWFSLCQPENPLEEKPVDVRLRNNEGRKGKSFSDLVRRKHRLVTAKQFSLPRLRSDSVVRRPWKGAQTSCHQQTTQEAKRKMLPRTWRIEGCLGWCTTRGQRRNDDAHPASQLIWKSTCSARHEHSFWARASRIQYGHIQTKLTFICGFSLTPPPPPAALSSWHIKRSTSCASAKDRAPWLCSTRPIGPNCAP